VAGKTLGANAVSGCKNTGDEHDRQYQRQPEGEGESCQAGALALWSSARSDHHEESPGLGRQFVMIVDSC
jgi:hypothetical protein